MKGIGSMLARWIGQGGLSLTSDDMTKSAGPPKAGHFAAWFLLKYLIAPILAVVFSLSMVGRFTTWWSGPDSYKIYLVGDRGDPETKSIFEALKAAKGDTTLKINGVPVKFEERDDKGDPVTAQQVAPMVAAEDDALLVVGHFVSSQTKVALPSYVKASQPDSAAGGDVSGAQDRLRILCGPMVEWADSDPADPRDLE